jgi:hypothetical protein
MMSSDSKKRPPCFADLDKVFPLREDGFRVSPIECLQCVDKTECLKHAIGEASGFSVREEMIDRAYRGGAIGFLQRWSQKKNIHRMKRKKASGKP